jgi:hypothetical protein
MYQLYALLLHGDTNVWWMIGMEDVQDSERRVGKKSVADKKLGK